MSQDHYEQRVWPLLYYIRKENRKLWQRNAAVALGNQGDPEAIPGVDRRPGGPGTSGPNPCGLGSGKNRREAGESALEKRRSLEEDESVRKEIEEALKEA